MGIEWQFFVMLVWAVCVAVGSLIAVRTLKFWGSILVTLGSGLSVLCVSAMMGIRILELWARYRDRPGLSYNAIEKVAGVGMMGGLVFFAVGFFGVAARYGMMLRRTGELENLAEVLQSRIKGGGS